MALVAQQTEAAYGTEYHLLVVGTGESAPIWWWGYDGKIYSVALDGSVSAAGDGLTLLPISGISDGPYLASTSNEQAQDFIYDSSLNVVWAILDTPGTGLTIGRQLVKIDVSTYSVTSYFVTNIRSVFLDGSGRLFIQRDNDLATIQRVDKAAPGGAVLETRTFPSAIGHLVFVGTTAYMVDRISDKVYWYAEGGSAQSYTITSDEYPRFLTHDPDRESIWVTTRRDQTFGAAATHWVHEFDLGTNAVTQTVELTDYVPESLPRYASEVSKLIWSVFTDTYRRVVAFDTTTNAVNVLADLSADYIAALGLVLHPNRRFYTTVMSDYSLSSPNYSYTNLTGIGSGFPLSTYPHSIDAGYFLWQNDNKYVLVDPYAAEEAGVVATSATKYGEPSTINLDWDGNLRIYGSNGVTVSTTTSVNSWDGVEGSTPFERTIWYDVTKVYSDANFVYVYTNGDNALRKIAHEEWESMPPVTGLNGTEWLYWKDEDSISIYTLPVQTSSGELDYYGEIQWGDTSSYPLPAAYFNLPDDMILTAWGTVTTPQSVALGYNTPKIYIGIPPSEVDLAALAVAAGYRTSWIPNAPYTFMGANITYNPDRRCIAGLGYDTLGTGGGYTQWIWEYYPDTGEYKEIDTTASGSNSYGSVEYGFGRYWFRSSNTDSGFGYYDTYTGQQRVGSAQGQFVWGQWKFFKPMVISRTCVVSVWEGFEAGNSNRVARYCLEEESDGLAIAWGVYSSGYSSSADGAAAGTSTATSVSAYIQCVWVTRIRGRDDFFSFEECLDPAPVRCVVSTSGTASGSSTATAVGATS